MTRQFWTLIHRYVGLAMTIFRIIVGVTGSDRLGRGTNPNISKQSEFRRGSSGAPLA